MLGLFIIVVVIHLLSLDYVGGKVWGSWLPLSLTFVPPLETLELR